MRFKILLKPVLLLISTLTVMSGATIAPSLPQMAETFQDIPHALFLSKLILTLPALSIAIAGPFSGVLVDRLGRLKVLYPALILYALSGAIGFFVRDIYVILMGRIFLGISVAGIMTVAITLIGDYFEGRERNAFIGYQAAFMSLGGAVFVSLGGYLADLHWTFPFLIYGFSLLTAVLGAFCLYEPKKKNTGPNKGFELKEYRPILGILFVALTSMVVFYMLPVQLPFLLREIGVEKNSQSGLAIGMATLVASGVGLFYNKISTKFEVHQIFVLLFLTMGSGFLVVSLSHQFIWVLIAMAITGLGMGLLMPNLNYSLLSLSNEENRGRFSGALSAALFLGQFLSPILLAPVNSTFGLSTGYLVGAAVLYVLAVLFMFRKQLFKI